jgi:hypothetical protein
MKIFIGIFCFISLLYSCDDKSNELKSIQYVKPVEETIPKLPDTEEADINIDLQILGNLKLPKISGKDSNELHRNADRRHEAFTRYLRRNDPTYKPHQISGVSIVQMDADYEALFKLAEIERKKIEKKSRQNANKLFGE